MKFLVQIFLIIMNIALVEIGIAILKTISEPVLNIDLLDRLVINVNTVIRHCCCKVL